MTTYILALLAFDEAFPEKLATEKHKGSWKLQMFLVPLLLSPSPPYLQCFAQLQILKQRIEDVYIKQINLCQKIT